MSTVKPTQVSSSGDVREEKAGGSQPGPNDEALPFGTSSLPENCVEYMLFLIDSQLDSRRILPRLEAVKKDVIRLVDSLAKDYIWQRDSFTLEVKSQSGMLYLYGSTDYGDSVEDEWLIVYIFRELSRAHQNIWVRTVDSDGEFLLIEAANVAPKWLNPENDNNRVWIHDGKLVLVPLGDRAGGGDGDVDSGSSKSVAAAGSKSITLAEAVDFIKTRPNSLVHSTFVESEAFYRLEKYPAQITESTHYSLVTIPRKLAYILHDRPKAIAPAVEAYYLRDPIALKPLMSNSPDLEFPPTDLVTVSTRFTKVLFAQLKAEQRVQRPPAWAPLLKAAENESAATKSDDEAERKLARLEIGMKVTTGFELLAAVAHKSRSRIAREVAIVLDDLREDGPGALPTDSEIRGWKDIDREDDEAWLDINFDEFDRELQGERGGAPGATQDGAGFGDANTQADLRKIVSRFEAFLNDEDAGIDGAEVDEMDVDDDDDDDFSSGDDDSDEEDKEVSFDEAEFARMMREMMGLPAADVKGKAKAPAAAQKRDQLAEEAAEEDEEIQKLAAQMEAELNQHGALKLDPTPKKLAALQRKEAVAASREVSGASKKAPTIEDHDEEGDDGDAEVDIDYNLAKNLLESFKGQAGMAGPAGNIMSMLGMTLPRDEDDDHDTGTRKAGRS